MRSSNSTICRNKPARRARRPQLVSSKNRKPQERRAPGQDPALDLFQGPRARRPRDSRRDAGATFWEATFLAGLHYGSGVAQPSNLFHMMQAVHQVKFSPLASGEGSEDGMVEQRTARAQVLFTARNAVVHFADL